MSVAGTMADDALAQYADKLIYLCSAQASHQLIIVAQRKVETQLDGLKLDYVKIDGMVEENKPARAAIWKKCDAKPGTYPIVLNMKTGDFWHGDDLQATQRHARAALEGETVGGGSSAAFLLTSGTVLRGWSFKCSILLTIFWAVLC